MELLLCVNLQSLQKWKISEVLNLLSNLHGRLNCQTSRKLSDMSNLNERIYLQLSQKGEVKHESTKKYVRLRLKVLLREDDVLPQWYYGFHNHKMFAPIMTREIISFSVPAISPYWKQINLYNTKRVGVCTLIHWNECKTICPSINSRVTICIKTQKYLNFSVQNRTIQNMVNADAAGEWIHNYMLH